MLRGFLARRRVNEHDAADIVQEAYCRILKTGHVLSIRHPRAFLLQVAINVLRNNAKHRRAGVEDDAVDIDSVDIDAKEPSQYRRFKAAQELAIVRAALEELAPKCREVFVMNRFEHLSYSQISSELDLSVSMIEKYVSQALAHLRKQLADSAIASRKHRSSLPAKSPS
jgi:RNA polymerase sigma-70 factor (ECF subfamily)